MLVSRGDFDALVLPINAIDAKRKQVATDPKLAVHRVLFLSN